MTYVSLEFLPLAEASLAVVGSGCSVAELDQRLDKSGGQFEIVDAQALLAGVYIGHADRQVDGFHAVPVEDVAVAAAAG